MSEGRWVSRGSRWRSLVPSRIPGETGGGGRGGEGKKIRVKSPPNTKGFPRRHTLRGIMREISVNIARGERERGGRDGHRRRRGVPHSGEDSKGDRVSTEGEGREPPECCSLHRSSKRQLLSLSPAAIWWWSAQSLFLVHTLASLSFLLDVCVAFFSCYSARVAKDAGSE